MPLKPRPGEQYTIRRKLITIFGASFHIYGPDGQVVGYCRQKAFKLREDIRLFTDESRSTEIMVMKARQIIDFGATYDVTLSDGRTIGSLRRKGFKSLLRAAPPALDELRILASGIQRAAIDGRQSQA